MLSDLELATVTKNVLVLEYRHSFSISFEIKSLLSITIRNITQA